MKVTYYGTEITMEFARSYGHYRINQYDCHGKLIYTNVVTDSMAYDDYNDLKNERFYSERQKKAKLKNVRNCLSWDKYNHQPYRGWESLASYKYWKEKSSKNK